MRRQCGFVPNAQHIGFLVFTIGCLAGRSWGLTIDLSYDSSVTSLPYAALVESATNYAAQQLENVVTDNITINIDVQANDDAFGGSATGLGGIYSFADIRNDLAAKATTAVDTSAVAMLNALPDPTRGGNFWIPGAEMKALGLSDPNGSGNDGTFVFGTNNPWNFSTTNRAVSGEYDFVGVALHELTECIGRTSVLGGDLNGSPGWIPFDLFRFTQPGYESTNDQDNGVYFSVDQGNTNLKNYNPASNGGDLQDWAAGTPDAANQASVQGTENDLSPADIATLDAIGYTPVTAPRTLTWDGSHNLLDSSHWLYNSEEVPAYIGAALVVNSGTLAYTPPDVHSNLILSNTSIYGTGLTITGGSVSTLVNTFVSGLGPGTGAGLYLTTGSSLNISGTGQLNLAGELVIGGDAGSNVTATISGGSLVVGQNNSSNVDPTLYVGLAGTGTLIQSGTSTVTTQNLCVGALAGSIGSYQMNGGTLTVNDAMVLSGSLTTTNGGGSFNADAGTIQSRRLEIWKGRFFSNGTLTVTGTTTNNGTLDINSGTAVFNGIGGSGLFELGYSGRGGPASSSTVHANGVNQGTLSIAASSILYLPTNTEVINSVSALSIDATAVLDLGGNVIDVNYAPNSTPAATIRSYLVSGYDHGNWNGQGIISSTAASNSQHSTSVGYIDTGSQIIIKYTWVGDANLDGVVNSLDLADIKSNGTTWATGDFNYDGKVNGDDYSLFMLGAADGGATNISATLPEPAGAISILATTLILLRRRRR